MLKRTIQTRILTSCCLEQKTKLLMTPKNVSYALYFILSKLFAVYVYLGKPSCRK